jgi:tetratricopeptide (TPR) repeat protein
MAEILGEELFKQGEFAQAIPLLKETLANDPNNVLARNYLAISYSQTNEKMEAVNEFLRLTELEPNNPQFFSNLGIAYEGVNNIIKAKECYEKAISINPGYEKAAQKLKVINDRIDSVRPGQNQTTVQPLGGIPQNDNQNYAQPQQPPPVPQFSQQYNNIPPSGQTINIYNPGGQNIRYVRDESFQSKGNVCGIIGICIALFIPLVGLILGIIALARGEDNRIFGTIAIVLSLLSWLIASIFLSSILSSMHH